MNMYSKAPIDQQKLKSAIALFKQGKLSSGMAARMCQVPRTHFLMEAMKQGANLLENSEEDYAREMTLLSAASKS
jgi:predicted HTH domain antitoxin